MFEGKSWNSISISLEGDFCLSIDQPRRLSTGDPQSIIGFDTKNGLMTWMICGYPLSLRKPHKPPFLVGGFNPSEKYEFVSWGY